MTIKKVGLSLLAIATLSSAAFAVEVGSGTLRFTDDGNLSSGVTDSFVIGTEYFEALKAGNQSININNVSGRYLTYTADIKEDNSVSDANIIVTPLGDNTFDSDNIDYGNLNLAEVNATGGVVDIISASASDNGNGGILFDSDSTKNIINGRTYRIVDDQNASVALPLVVNSDSVATTYGLDLKVYSASGTVELRDEAKTATTTEKPQYAITCDGKFDGMINYENNSHTFVTTGHGFSDENTTDSLMFTITNNAADIDFTLDENITFNIQAKDLNASEYSIFSSNLINIVKTDDGNITFTTDNAPFAAVNHYTLFIQNNNGVAIPEVQFSDINATFEHNVTVEPASYAKGTGLGEWKNYTYVAQIPGATSDGHVESKLFIVNRNCSDTMPTFKVVYNGYVVTVPASDVANLTNFTSDFKVAKDSQGIVAVKDIVAAANLKDSNIPTTGRFAVEVVIPGLAESWYVYAQAKNEDVGGQFKDLPVYSTSTRSY